MTFGTVKHVFMGPTSLMALLTYEYTKNLTPEYVVLLTFMCGIVEISMGLFKLGKSFARESIKYGCTLYGRDIVEIEQSEQLDALSIRLT